MRGEHVKVKPIDILDDVERMAVEYRYRNRLVDDNTIEVNVPHEYAVSLIQRYGSLQAAADAKFRPGTVRIVDSLIVQLQKTANLQMQVMFPPYRVGSVNDWMRIALQPYLR